MRDRRFGRAIGEEKLGGGAVLVGGEGETVDFGEIGEEDFREDEWHSRGGVWLWTILVQYLVACLPSVPHPSQHSHILILSSRRGCCRMNDFCLLSEIILPPNGLQFISNCCCSVNAL